MTEDARFEDGVERSVKLRALDGDDLAVISALVQDSVLSGADMRWVKSKRRFALLLNRYRWEDGERAARVGDHERVRSLLAIEDVVHVRASGVERGAEDTVLSLLSVTFEAGEDGTGEVILTFAGDGAIAIRVEALEVFLQDVTRPYVAPSGKGPSHNL